jgi:thioredoxin-related protein
MKKALEYTAYLALIVASLTATYVLVDQTLANHKSTAALNPSVLLNKKLPLDNAAWGNAHYTVVIAMTTVCHFCHDSIPFYKSLADMEHNRPGQFQMVTVSPEAQKTTGDYLQQNQMPVDRVESAFLSSIDVSGTPTVFVVDSSGTVKKVYVGQLPPSRQQELIAYVTQVS